MGLAGTPENKLKKLPGWDPASDEAPHCFIFGLDRFRFANHEGDRFILVWTGSDTQSMKATIYDESSDKQTNKAASDGRSHLRDDRRIVDGRSSEAGEEMATANDGGTLLETEIVGPHPPNV